MNYHKNKIKTMKWVLVIGFLLMLLKFFLGKNQDLLVILKLKTVFLMFEPTQKC